MNQNAYSFLLTTIAGLSTLIGFLFLWIKSKEKKNLISICLSFAAGVMISISLMELFPEAILLLHQKYDFTISLLLSLIFANIGVILSKWINKYIKIDNKLYHLGIVSMIVIALHNLPEGIATYLTSEKNIHLGFSLAFSIALHNIPEGVTIAIPIYYATKNKSKAFLYTLIAGISEPIGAILAHFLLRPWINNIFMGNLYSFIAGMMIYISITELLPEALSYTQHKKTIFSFIVGFLFMIFIKMIK